MNKLKNLFKAHKIISSLVIIIVLVGGFFIYRSLTSTTGTPTYTLSRVRKGTLTTTVTGTGQVAAVNQVALTSKVSGSISSLPVKVGQPVYAGQVIARIGGSDAVNAALDLQNARISYDQLDNSNSTTLLKSQNSVSTAQDNLSKDYSAAYSSMVQSYNDLANVITETDVFYNQGGYIYGYVAHSNGNNISEQMSDQINLDQESYISAKNSFLAAQSDFSSISRTSDNATIERALNNAYSAARSLSQGIKSTSDLLNFLKARESNSLTSVNTAITQVVGYSSSASGDVANLLSAINSITADKQALAEAKSSLSGTGGSSELSLSSQDLAIRQKEQALSDYTITSPITGIVGALSVNDNDTVNSGTAIATIVTKQSVAEITLNEVDAAKVKSGDRAMMTFDALPNVTASGTVVEIDSIGTVTQGVVNYGAKISIDLSNDQIKPGMSVAVTIITSEKPNVLLVPSTAVKSDFRGSYVQTLPAELIPANNNSNFNFASSTATGSSTRRAVGNNTVTTTVAPTQVRVKVGDSNDTFIEITSGLNEGDYVISRTTTSATTGTTGTTGGASSANRSLLGGGAAGAGGAIRRAGFGG